MDKQRFAGVGQPQRGEKSYLSAFVAPEAKARLVAAAESRGTTMTALLEAMAMNAEPIMALMGPSLNSGRVVNHSSQPTAVGR